MVCNWNRRVYVVVHVNRKGLVIVHYEFPNTFPMMPWYTSTIEMPSFILLGFLKSPVAGLWSVPPRVHECERGMQV